ncbi:phosphatidate cytidylyltransferase [Jimgerdemannia flammicorona]|uniref:Phosphatidate cytidylyltransferase n=1 Tax=Jimgerdemannia flammicorona TaxID=994334 RepID=A0A433QKC7_9FUNG|nr:phosphatidate cytidylyltransferase [Jimgerdemannia flammicorona]
MSTGVLSSYPLLSIMLNLPPPTSNDVIGLFLSFSYSLSLLGVAEVIRVLYRFDTDFTRKIVHVGAGCWVWGVLYFFDHWEYAMIPFTSYIGLNWVFLRWRILKSATPGTVYFCISITLLLSTLHTSFQSGFPRGPISHIIMTGAMAMTFGDAMASLVGRRFGKHRLTSTGLPYADPRKSVEGATACFVTVFCTTIVTFVLTSPVPGGMGTFVVFGGAVVAAVLATLLEAVSPHGIDNLTVPLGVPLGLWLLGF